MVPKLQTKRYIRRLKAQQLLAHYIEVAMKGKDATLEEIRDLVAMLLKARVSNAVVGRETHREVKSLSEEQLREHQRQMALFLHFFTTPDPPATQLEKLWIRTKRGVEGDQVVVVIDGAIRDVVTYQETFLLQTAGVRRLQRCDCGTVFTRVGRQEFCSKRCQKRVYMRTARASEKESKR